MGMVVRTNTMAMNANRQLGVNNSSLAKSLEKLSSGFRINRAGDDASGLAISEKMKAQIKGLEQASANSQDGISLIQTAEGATTEIHNMLNRMVELATKSANGTIQNKVDREAIQAEVDALNGEITRIAKSTNFNGINLLDGSLSTGVNITSAVVAGAKVTPTALAATASSSTVAVADGDSATGLKATIKYMDASGAEKTVDVTYDSGDDQAASATGFVTAAKGVKELTDLFEITATATGATFASKATGADAPKLLTTAANAGVTIAADGDAGTDGGSKVAGAPVAGDSITINGKTFSFVTAGNVAPSGTIGVAVGGAIADTITNINKAFADNDIKGITAALSGTTDIAYTAAASGTGLTLQVGDTADDFNKITVNVDDLSAAGLKTASLKVDTEADAAASIQTIKDAINKVSTNRANLGALQNRLEYTINNLDTTTENMSAANSRIRDTDMAKEMTNYTKMNILTQAAQAMLAQANTQPQQILQLLQ